MFIQNRQKIISFFTCHSVIADISTGIKCSNKLILDNSVVLLHVVAINNLFTAL